MVVPESSIRVLGFAAGYQVEEPEPCRISWGVLILGVRVLVQTTISPSK